MATGSRDSLLEEKTVHESIFSDMFKDWISRKMINFDEVATKFTEQNSVSDIDSKFLNSNNIFWTRCNKLLQIVSSDCNKKNSDLRFLESFISIMGETQGQSKDLKKKLTELKHTLVQFRSMEKEIMEKKALVEDLKSKLALIGVEKGKKDKELRELQRNKTMLTEELTILQTNESNQKQDLQALKKEITKKDDNILAVEKNLKDLSEKKYVLEQKVDITSLAFRNSDKQRHEAEKKLQTSIQENKKMTEKIKILQEQLNEATVTIADKEKIAKEIEKLEDDIIERDNTILGLQRRQTLTRGELNEELTKITRGQEKKINEQNEKIDLLTNTVTNKFTEILNLLSKQK